MGKNKALAHHASTYFHQRRVSIQLSFLLFFRVDALVTFVIVQNLSRKIFRTMRNGRFQFFRCRHVYPLQVALAYAHARQLDLVPFLWTLRTASSMHCGCRGSFLLPILLTSPPLSLGLLSGRHPFPSSAGCAIAAENTRPSHRPSRYLPVYSTLPPSPPKSFFY